MREFDQRSERVSQENCSPVVNEDWEKKEGEEEGGRQLSRGAAMAPGQGRCPDCGALLTGPSQQGDTASCQ